MRDARCADRVRSHATHVAKAVPGETARTVRFAWTASPLEPVRASLDTSRGNAGLHALDTFDGSLMLNVRHFALGLTVASSAHTQPSPPRTEMQMVRAELIAGLVKGLAHGDLPRYRAALLRSYPDSATHLLWSVNRQLTAQANAMLAELIGAEARGLRQADYDGESLRAEFGDTMAEHTRTELERLRTDVWLTMSAMRFMDHLHRGRVDPRRLGFALVGAHRSLDEATDVLSLSRSPNVASTLNALEPPFVYFRELKTLLARYRTLAADSALTPSPILNTRAFQAVRSIDSARVQRLLIALGDLPDTGAASVLARPDDVGPSSMRGVKHFQQRHGLTADGSIGAATLRALQTPLSQRVAQIVLTMERWRWLPDITSPRLILVNIPAYRLYAFDRSQRVGMDRPVVRMDVIVGSAYRRRRTPVFSGDMREVVFHPYWNVPASIARREEIPRMRHDPAYADRQGLEIVRGDDANATILPITETTLQRAAAGELRVRQRPGATNALGPVKFLFPNQYDVYLHGTPVQSLFAQTARDFSHGCIRVSDPALLAAFVMSGLPGWDSTRIDGAMHGADRTQRVVLSQPLPVYILYGTVVQDDENVAHFYPDVYGHDAALARALGAPAPIR